MTSMNDLLQFVSQITDAEVSEQVLGIVDKAADVYVEPLCGVIARSTNTMFLKLNKYFSHEDSMRILVAMISKQSGGGNK